MRSCNFLRKTAGAMVGWLSVAWKSGGKPPHSEKKRDAIIRDARRCQGAAGVYWVADFSPRRRMRSCNFLRKTAGALGLNATRYHKG
jgi:hypothetical protein